jgi:hypothetical protein
MKLSAFSEHLAAEPAASHLKGSASCGRRIACSENSEKPSSCAKLGDFERAPRLARRFRHGLAAPAPQADVSRLQLDELSVAATEVATKNDEL